MPQNPEAKQISNLEKQRAKYGRVNVAEYRALQQQSRLANKKPKKKVPRKIVRGK